MYIIVFLLQKNLGNTIGKYNRKFGFVGQEKNLYKFMCLCFGLGPTLQNFHKTSENPNLRRINWTTCF